MIFFDELVDVFNGYMMAHQHAERAIHTIHLFIYLSAVVKMKEIYWL